jgi:hypothetical protein
MWCFCETAFYGHAAASTQAEPVPNKNIGNFIFKHILFAYSFEPESVSIVCVRISKLLRSPRINSKESIPPAYVAWQAGTTNPVPTRFLALIDCFIIPALVDVSL